MWPGGEGTVDRSGGGRTVLKVDLREKRLSREETQNRTAGQKH